MGMFSQDCSGCGHPLLSVYAINGVNSWMNLAVAILKNGSVIHGSYDGYGRIDDLDVIADNDCTVWHTACWKVAGQPTDYRGPSTWSDDQGYFFDEGAHDMDEPGASEATR